MTLCQRLRRTKTLAKGSGKTAARLVQFIQKQALKKSGNKRNRGYYPNQNKPGIGNGTGRSPQAGERLFRSGSVENSSRHFVIFRGPGKGTKEHENHEDHNKLFQKNCLLLYKRFDNLQDHINGKDCNKKVQRNTKNCPDI
jgi:hypothetical protein